MNVAMYLGEMWYDSLKIMVPLGTDEWLGITFGDVSLVLEKIYTINITRNKLIGITITTICKRWFFYDLGITLCIFTTFYFCKKNM